MNQRQSLLITSFLVFLLCLTFWLYQPARNGGLIFDDIPNLQPWQEIGNIRSAQDLARLVFSSPHLPGRPLSLASFTIDDQSWPLDTDRLKRTNILLHMLNAILVFFLLRLMLLRLTPPYRAHLIALTATAIWALHPMQVSTAAYIIQRMALLSTSITLIALLLYCHGRNHLSQTPWRSLCVCSASIGLIMPLGMLAKENALLTCSYALLIEVFFFQAPLQGQLTIAGKSISLQTLWHQWKLVALWLPCFIFAAYCIHVVLVQPDGFETRNFTAGERFLTQGPVLADYLSKLLLPQSGGLFFDNFPVSRGMDLHTSFTWTAIIVILGFAFLFKKKHPIASFGVFFYFSGHLMESTVIPLELYFEHRNYLPQLGIWLALSSMIAEFANTPRKARYVVFMLTLVLATLGILTRQNTVLWGNNKNLITSWYIHNPTSLRAGIAYAKILVSEGRTNDADSVLTTIQKNNPSTLTPILVRRYWNCQIHHESIALADLAPKAKVADYDVTVISILMDINQRTRTSNNADCPHTELPAIKSIMLALLANPHYSSHDTVSALNMNLGELAAASGDLESTIAYYDSATKAVPNPVYAYKQAHYLMSAEIPDAALEYLSISSRLLTWRYRMIYPDLAEKIQVLRDNIKDK